MSRRQQGMFANAKISEKVFKNLPSKIARGVQKDLAYIFKKDKPAPDASPAIRSPPRRNAKASNEDKFPFFRNRGVKRNIHAAARNNDIVAPQDVPSGSRPPHRRYVETTDDETFPTSHVAAPRVERKILHVPKKKMAPRDASCDSRFPQRRYVKGDMLPTNQFAAQFTSHHHGAENLHVTKKNPASCDTPTVFKSPPRVPAEDPADPPFPSEPDREQIAARILSGLPHLPLRNSDPITYSGAVEEVLLNALSQWFPNDGEEITIGSKSRREQHENIDPHRSFMDKTAPLNNSLFSDHASERSESPLNTLDFTSLRRAAGGLTNDEMTIIREDFNEIDLNSTFLPPRVPSAFRTPGFSTLFQDVQSRPPVDIENSVPSFSGNNFSHFFSPGTQNDSFDRDFFRF